MIENFDRKKEYTFDKTRWSQRKKEPKRTDYVSTGFDNMAMQQGIITQDEKFVKGFFDQQERNKKLRNKL